MRTLTIAVFLMTCLGCGTGPRAQAHAMLDHASPAVGSTVASSPGAVTLYFTESLEPKFSGGEVHNAAGARVDHGASVSGKVMRLSVGALPAGSYSVRWHALYVEYTQDARELQFHHREISIWPGRLRASRPLTTRRKRYAPFNPRIRNRGLAVYPKCALSRGGKGRIHLGGECLVARDGRRRGGRHGYLTIKNDGSAPDRLMAASAAIAGQTRFIK